MTRNTSASFAQFFPAAPRVARDRAKERERARAKTQDLIGTSLGSHPTRNGALGDMPNAARGPATDGTFLNGSHQADDHGSPSGDTLNTVASASSYASTGSSIFSTSQRHLIPNGASQVPSTTPLTTIESPSLLGHTNQPDSKPIHSQISDRDDFTSTRKGSVSHLDGSSPHASSHTSRVPARDPTRSRKGIKCTYDPLLDRTLSKDKMRITKPTFQEFGAVRSPILYLYGGGGASSLCYVRENDG